MKPLIWFLSALALIGLGLALEDDYISFAPVWLTKIWFVFFVPAAVLVVMALRYINSNNRK